MRVAVSQFATSLNTQKNLATCIRMINEAAECRPSLIILPEFCNTQPWYADGNQAWEQALTSQGEFLQQIAEQAKKHGCYIVLGVTLRRELSYGSLSNKQGEPIQSHISVTSCVFSPCGELIHKEDKQRLTEHEKQFFTYADNPYGVISTAIGKIGLLSGNDSMTFKASRTLALSGAQLLCNSTNAFAQDQTSLHDPARACENKVFLATANKIGVLIPHEQLTQSDTKTLSAHSAILPANLVGLGQSQIVSPDGQVLAKMANDEEGYVFADITLADVGLESSNNFRPDGTDITKQRRPELYQKLTETVKQQTEYEPLLVSQHQVPVTANVAIFATYKSDEQAIDDVCHYIENNLSDIIQLPELFFISDKNITNNAEQLIAAERLSKLLITQISSVLRCFQYVCTSLVIDGMHQAVIISEYGLLATQPQLHFCKRYQWTTLGDELKAIELPLEQGRITVTMLTADDANIPELVSIAASNAIHLLLVPFDIQEPSEVEYNLLARAVENRVCVVAASREKSFSNDFSTPAMINNVFSKNKIKQQKSTGVIINLTTEPSLLPQWRSPKYNGYINQPLVKHQYGKITKAVIHPIAACNKLMTAEYLA